MRAGVLRIAILGALLGAPVCVQAQSAPPVPVAETGQLPMGWREAGAARVHASGLRCDHERAGYQRSAVGGGLIEPAGCDYLNALDIRIRVLAGPVLDHESARLETDHAGLERRAFNWAETPENARIHAWTTQSGQRNGIPVHFLVIETGSFTLSLNYSAELEGEALEAAARFVEAGLRG